WFKSSRPDHRRPRFSSVGEGRGRCLGRRCGGGGARANRERNPCRRRRRTASPTWVRMVVLAPALDGADLRGRLFHERKEWLCHGRSRRRRGASETLGFRDCWGWCGASWSPVNSRDVRGGPRKHRGRRMLDRGLGNREGDEQECGRDGKEEEAL